ncbi:glycosyltransferase family 2 protein [Gloeobacter kilaueensis]|uniref:Rhamnosyltransferase n=1 Tax=Gloeobacter kilaueensis (strain ATCC BAA-2537 / CCAP 1431/1 / ULC 316 / JS1) TaxID=1183438 RepID=U5QG64_GLOK1|nr:glycosyltransferase family 2 protein [Gloeobacter kilaueensis]AGY57848.1 rhamnosyltransferase [Gloeobacter kilaueensis JS1]
MHSVKKREEFQDICAVVVTYNPEASLIANIRELRKQISSILIVDNASNNPALAYIADLEAIEGVKVIYNRRNIGLAAALNIGYRYACARKYTWLLTFDQDSTITPGYIAAMLDAYGSYDKRDRLAILSPIYYFPATQAVCYHNRDRSSPIAVIERTMTSGMMIKIEALDKIGGFDEDFFIDCIDHELCLRCLDFGYKLIEVRGAKLAHSLGNSEQRKLLNWTFTITNHTPSRRYYNARNRLLTYKKYLMSHPVLIAKDLSNFVFQILKIIFYEKDALTKLSYTAKGCYHGIIGRTGEYK